MQISNNLSLSSIASDLGLGQSKSKPSSSQSGAGDQVQISSLASQMASDPSKLNQLAASFEAGTYSVSPTQIANSILNDAMLS